MLQVTDKSHLTLPEIKPFHIENDNIPLNPANLEVPIVKGQQINVMPTEVVRQFKCYIYITYFSLYYLFCALILIFQFLKLKIVL